MATHTIAPAAGFHPHIYTNITFKHPPSRLDCIFDIIYIIPREAFVDANQLTDLKLSKHLVVLNESDLEAPAERVRGGNLVAVRYEAEDYLMSLGKEVTIDLPLHMRYQQPDSLWTHQTVAIPVPKVGWTCSIEPYQKPNSIPPLPSIDFHLERDSRTTFDEIESSVVGNMTVSIPVGRTTDTNTVKIGTHVIVLFGALWIAWAIYSAVVKRKRTELKGKRRKSE
ncbi:hypothetical protein INT43_004598 [Umbelopsis isabellina]|uniref:Protein PBN1 n=1 Tax=Mortierella isabellina TaxID=91625 RepID=A0A8H7PGH6_MORIS|nr:hypothetical protein INT43_004598 [Umbelopsis isabellina]